MSQVQSENETSTGKRGGAGEARGPHGGSSRGSVQEIPIWLDTAYGEIWPGLSSIPDQCVSTGTPCKRPRDCSRSRPKWWGKAAEKGE